MRRSMFGDFFATSADEDIGEAFMEKGFDPDECFADVTEEDGEYLVEIRSNEDGETVISTDEGLFDNADAARAWARQWVSQVHNNF